VGTALTGEEFADQFRRFEHTAFRLELQRAYREPSEAETVAKFLGGDPEPPTQVDGLRAWFEQVAAQTREGKCIERVRVHEDPPTDYQRWERWIDRWNTEAGETIRYLTRPRALVGRGSVRRTATALGRPAPRSSRIRQARTYNP
jgi:hypothetical protein